MQTAAVFALHVSKKEQKMRTKSDTDKAKQNRKDYAKNPQMFLDQPGKKAKSISPIARKKKTGDARKAPKVHPMLAAARKRKPHPTGGHPLTPERPKLVYKKGKGIYSNSVRSPNW